QFAAAGRLTLDRRRIEGWPLPVPPTPAKDKEEKKEEKTEPKREPPKPPPPVVQKPAVEQAPITLGGDAFNLTVRLTPRGAAVRSVVLNKFKAADKYGRPTGELLHLVPEEADRGLASNVLYHYGAEDDERPWDTLGLLDWAVEAKEDAADAEAHRVIFAADVPGTDIRVRKIYTLEKGTYHLGLAVELERKQGTGQEPVRLRYQLTGAHGLPIEGV